MVSFNLYGADLSKWEKIIKVFNHFGLVGTWYYPG